NSGNAEPPGAQPLAPGGLLDSSHPPTPTAARQSVESGIFARRIGRAMCRTRSVMSSSFVRSTSAFDGAAAGPGIVIFHFALATESPWRDSFRVGTAPKLFTPAWMTAFPDVDQATRSPESQ